MVYTSTHQPSTMRRTYAVTGFLSVTTVILLVTLLILTIQWSQLRQQALEAREQQVCVLCGTLANPDPEKNDTDTCCGPTSVILNDLIGKFSRQKFAEGETTRVLSNYGDDTCSDDWVPIAVKLLGINRDAQLQEENQVIHFKNDPDTNEAHFENENGELHVNKRGFYHIYSQIKITYTPGDTDVVFKHWINHHSPDGTHRKLLESSKSSCESVSDQSKITLMHGAVFELNEGDKVSAMTSHPHDLTSLDHDHFFGMYSLSVDSTISQ